jgi:GrpB-like predicted nucleotidyltransferase (UPF0157 family)
MKTIVVVEYDAAWPSQFEQLRRPIAAALGDVAMSIEHVGSTSVPGLAAKPIIDISVVVRDDEGVRGAIDRLATIGYVHQGNLGIEGREAFASPAGSIAHHLYVCNCASPGLANHLAVRDHLRAHPDNAREYGELKKQLAKQFPHDIEGYIAGKTDFLLRILRLRGFAPDQLEAVAAANRAKPADTRST